MRALYARFAPQEMPHDEAFRLTLARILVAPAFLYRVERTRARAQGKAPVSDSELACRLSYFLWSSLPDEELRRLAAAGRLSDPETLVAQTRRMLRDDKTRRLATEFACQWLHIYEFDQIGREERTAFPHICGACGRRCTKSRFSSSPIFSRTMVRCSVILDADHTFLNEELADSLRYPWRLRVPHWRRVDGVRQFGRGGISDAGQHACQAVGRVADQSHPARQLDQRSRCWVRSCRGRPRTCRSLPTRFPRDSPSGS